MQHKAMNFESNQKVITLQSHFIIVSKLTTWQLLKIFHIIWAKYSYYFRSYKPNLT